jgi:hypothetical protein
MSEHVDVQTVVGRTGAPDRKLNVLLWFGLLAAPIAWLFDLGLSFALVGNACRTGNTAGLWISTAGAFSISLAGAIVSGWAVGVLGRPNAHVQPMAERGRTMALAGLGLSALFALTIVAIAIPKLALSACNGILASAG